MADNMHWPIIGYCGKKKSADNPHWPQKVDRAIQLKTLYLQDNFYQSQLNFNLIMIYPAVIYPRFEQLGNLYKKALELTNLKADLS